MHCSEANKVARQDYKGLRSIRSGREHFSDLAENVVNAAGLGVIITGPLDADTPIIYANKAFEEITGYSVSEGTGRNPRFLQGSETDPQAVQQLRQAIHNGMEFRVVLRNYRKDGSPYWNEMTISPVLGDRRRITHFVGILADVSRRIETENQQAHLLAELQKLTHWRENFLRDVLASVTEQHLCLCISPVDLPSALPPCSPPVKLHASMLQAVRHNVVTVATHAGVSDERSAYLEIAVGEAILNAVVHGAGGEAQICAERDDKVQVWVRDRGTGIGIDYLHRATLERGYTTKGSMGHGFKLMLKCSDRIYLLTDATGTTVCIEEDVDAKAEERRKQALP
jgi:PAS domain S-box-containing protein